MLVVMKGRLGGSFGSSGYYKCVNIQSFLAPVVKQPFSPTPSVWSGSDCPAVHPARACLSHLLAGPWGITLILWTVQLLNFSF